MVDIADLALAILARAEDPGRPAEILAQQAPKAFADAIELRPDELIDFWATGDCYFLAMRPTAAASGKRTRARVWFGHPE